MSKPYQISVPLVTLADAEGMKIKTRYLSWHQAREVLNVFRSYFKDSYIPKAITANWIKSQWGTLDEESQMLFWYYHRDKVEKTQYKLYCAIKYGEGISSELRDQLGALESTRYMLIMTGAIENV